jgi:hypothetical protein
MKKGIAIILFVVILSNFVLSAQVVQQQPQEEKKKGFFDSVLGVIFSPLFLGAGLILILFIGLAVGAFFLIKWLIKYFKEQRDVFLFLKRKRIKMAKTHKRYSARHFLKVSKNTPIRLVRKNNNRVEISSPIGFYRGDYSTHEGNVMIALNLINMKKMLIFPITDILIIPNKESVKVHKKDKKGEDISYEINNLPTARDIVQFNESEVLIYAESLSNVGEFIIPVLKSKDGKVIDLSLPIYHTLREAILDNYLYDQTSQFATVSKKGLEINPFIRTIQKINDAGQNSETPTGMGVGK